MKIILYFMTLLCVALFPISCNTHKHTSTLQDDVNESKIFFDPEQQPYYLRGGGQGLLNDLYTTMLKTVHITQDCISGRAFVSFKITKDGIIDPNSIRIIRNKSVPVDYINAAIEAIKGLGTFEPGKMNGIPKAVYYTLPIRYPIPMELIKTSE